MRSILYDVIGRFVGKISSSIESRFEVADKYNSIHKYIKENCSAEMTSKSTAEHFDLLENTLSKNYKKDTEISLKSFINGQKKQLFYTER